MLAIVGVTRSPWLQNSCNKVVASKCTSWFPNFWPENINTIDRHQSLKLNGVSPVVEFLVSVSWCKAWMGNPQVLSQRFLNPIRLDYNVWWEVPQVFPLKIIMWSSNDCHIGSPALLSEPVSLMLILSPSKASCSPIQKTGAGFATGLP